MNLTNKIFICLCLGIKLGFYANAQYQQPIKELQIGDPCPDFQFANILNYSSTTARLSDFKGKVVIIDFWATWCAPCIESMSDLQKMQNLFSDKLQVITVTTEDSIKVNSKKKQNRILSTMTLPIIHSDRLLLKYFQHKTVPHTIIINENGIVQFITSSFDFTIDKMRAFLNNEVIEVKTKKENMKFDRDKPLLLGALGNETLIKPELLLYNSLLTKYIDGVSFGTAFPKVRAGVYAKIQANGPIINLYTAAIALRNLPFFL